MYWFGANNNCLTLALFHRGRKSLSIKFYILLSLMCAVILRSFTHVLPGTLLSVKLPPNCWQSSEGEDVVICCRRRLEDAARLSFDTWRASAHCWLFCCVKHLCYDSAMVLERILLLFSANAASVQLIIPTAFCQLPGSKEVALECTCFLVVFFKI